MRQGIMCKMFNKINEEIKYMNQSVYYKILMRYKK